MTANVLDGRPVLLRIAGRTRTARPEFVRDAHRVETLLDTIAKASPSTARFVPLPRTAEGRLEPAALTAAIAHGFGIVSWAPDPDGRATHGR